MLVDKVALVNVFVTTDPRRTIPELRLAAFDTTQESTDANWILVDRFELAETLLDNTPVNELTDIRVPLPAEIHCNAAASLMLVTIVVALAETLSDSTAATRMLVDRFELDETVSDNVAAA